jgi:hypothetical protein
MFDDTTRCAVVTAILEDVGSLLDWLSSSEALDLGTAERVTRERVMALGARLLEAGIGARGTGQVGARLDCGCGGRARFEGYRTKRVQTLVGVVRVRRAYYACGQCSRGQAPLDEALGVRGEQYSPAVRRLLCQFGALLPFAPAAALVAEASGIAAPPSTLRRLSEGWGLVCEQQLAAETAQGWETGWPAVSVPGPARLYLALDGVLVLETSGAGKEAKVGVLRPEQRREDGMLERGSASYVASFSEAAVFGRRLVHEAHQRGLEHAQEVVVLGDGAAWIWNLAAEHFPTATQVVDWYHASEHVWRLGRALYGADTPATTEWVEEQLRRLWAGEVAELLSAWKQLTCRGEAATVRDEEVTYFTNQAGRMDYAVYRGRGVDIGSGMIESACKYVIGTREKGPGMRWSVPGAQAIATLRVVLLNGRWERYDPASPRAA